MPRVFGLIRDPQRRLVGRNGVVKRPNPKALELQAAKEILAETFGIRVSEVEEMIQNRFEEAIIDRDSIEGGLWSREFWLEG